MLIRHFPIAEQAQQHLPPTTAVAKGELDHLRRGAELSRDDVTSLSLIQDPMERRDAPAPEYWKMFCCI